MGEYRPPIQSRIAIAGALHFAILHRCKDGMVPPPLHVSELSIMSIQKKNSCLVEYSRLVVHFFLVLCQYSVMRSQRSVYREICCFHIGEQWSCRGKGPNSPAPDFYLSSDSVHFILEMSNTLKKIF